MEIVGTRLLSDLIEEGSRSLRQAYGTLFSSGGSACAVGMAITAGVRGDVRFYSPLTSGEYLEAYRLRLQWRRDIQDWLVRQNDYQRRTPQQIAAALRETGRDVLMPVYWMPPQPDENPESELAGGFDELPVPSGVTKPPEPKVQIPNPVPSPSVPELGNEIPNPERELVPAGTM